MKKYTSLFSFQLPVISYQLKRVLVTIEPSLEYSKAGVTCYGGTSSLETGN